MIRESWAAEQTGASASSTWLCSWGPDAWRDWLTSQVRDEEEDDEDGGAVEGGRAYLRIVLVKDSGVNNLVHWIKYWRGICCLLEYFNNCYFLLLPHYLYLIPLVIFDWFDMICSTLKYDCSSAWNNIEHLPCSKTSCTIFDKHIHIQNIYEMLYMIWELNCLKITWTLLL